MSAYRLHVYVGRAQAAELEYDPVSGEFAWRYLPAWQASPDGFALAPSLPLEGAAASASVRRFLENLLPEGHALDVASVFWNIQKSNVFGLIRQLGRDTAGALTFVPSDEAADVAAWNAPVAREIDRDELQERIARRKELPFSVWDGKPRMSVAGFQDKLLVQKVGQRLLLVDGALASTHILKPQPLNPKLPHMVANEYFCMRLAQALGLRAYKNAGMAAEVEILRVPDPVLCVRRFDRQAVEGASLMSSQAGRLPAVRRLHIIDGCQALDLPPTMKYERNMGNAPDVRHIRDGVSLPRLFSARDGLAQPSVGARVLNFWTVMTLLLGNSDAHGKNMSYRIGPDGMSVAPLYDLVSVTQYDAAQIAHDLAMAVGDEFELQSLQSFALADHCERSGVDRRFFARELRMLCAQAAELAQELKTDPVYTEQERAFVADLASAVAQRAGLLANMAAKIPGFKDSDFN